MFPKAGDCPEKSTVPTTRQVTQVKVGQADVVVLLQDVPSKGHVLSLFSYS